VTPAAMCCRARAWTASSLPPLAYEFYLNSHKGIQVRPGPAAWLSRVLSSVLLLVHRAMTLKDNRALLHLCKCGVWKVTCLDLHIEQPVHVDILHQAKLTVLGCAVSRNKSVVS